MVVDASLAVKWVIQEPDSPTALILLTQWLVAGVRPIAPTFFASEVANIVYRASRAGNAPLSVAVVALQQLLGLVEVFPSSDYDYLRAMKIAAATEQSTPYDALYLTLAEREGCDYWTADGRFTRATMAQPPQVRFFTS